MSIAQGADYDLVPGKVDSSNMIAVIEALQRKFDKKPIEDLEDDVPKAPVIKTDVTSMIQELQACLRSSGGGGGCGTPPHVLSGGTSCNPGASPQPPVLPMGIRPPPGIWQQHRQQHAQQPRQKETTHAWQFSSEPARMPQQTQLRQQQQQQQPRVEAFHFSSEPPLNQRTQCQHQWQHQQQQHLQGQLAYQPVHGTRMLKTSAMNVIDFKKFGSEQTSTSTTDDDDAELFDSIEAEDEQMQSMMLPMGLSNNGVKTTLMVRNIPVMYTQEMLMLEWPNNGSYNFLYLPRSCAGQTNLSYCFINFFSEEHAMAFRAAWQKKRLMHFRARKSLNISLADVQGLKAHLQQLKRKRVRRIEMRQCQPYILFKDCVIGLTEALANVDTVDWDSAP